MEKLLQRNIKKSQIKTSKAQTMVNVILLFKCIYAYPDIMSIIIGERL